MTTTTRDRLSARSAVTKSIKKTIRPALRTQAQDCPAARRLAQVFATAIAFDEDRF